MANEMNEFQDYEITIIAAKRRKTKHVNMLENFFVGNHEYIKSVFNLADTMSNWRYDFQKTVRSLNLFKMEKESNQMIAKFANNIRITINNRYKMGVLKTQQVNNDTLLYLPETLPILYGDNTEYENLKKHCPEIKTKNTVTYHLHECVAQSVLETQNLLNEYENDDHFKQWWNSKNANWLSYHIVKNTMVLELPYTFNINDNDLAMRIKALIFINLCTVDKNGTPHSAFDYVDVHITKRKTNRANGLRILFDKHKSQTFIDGVLTK